MRWAIGWIAFFCVGLLTFWLGFTQKWWQKVPQPIQTFSQTCPTLPLLPAPYVAHLLQLKHTSWEEFDCKKAQEILLRSPWIASATVAKHAPLAVSVEYRLKSPCAALYEFPNFALDHAGSAFALSPFFTPKKLVSVHLGIESLQEIKKKKEEWQLAQTILEYLWPEHFKLLLIDVADSYSPHFGRRGVTLLVKENKRGIFWLLRCPTIGWKKQLGQFQKLVSLFPVTQRTHVVDLRMERMALCK